MRNIVICLLVPFSPFSLKTKHSFVVVIFTRSDFCILEAMVD